MNVVYTPGDVGENGILAADARGVDPQDGGRGGRRGGAYPYKKTSLIESNNLLHIMRADKFHIILLPFYRTQKT